MIIFKRDRQLEFSNIFFLYIFVENYFLRYFPIATEFNTKQIIFVTGDKQNYYKYGFQYS